MDSVYTQRYQHVLDQLQAARKESGLTQTEVAQAFGKPQSFVSKCESGERRVDVVELGYFAHLYDKPLAYFVSEGHLGGASLSLDRPRKKPSRAGTRAKARAAKPRRPRYGKAPGRRRGPASKRR